MQVHALRLPTLTYEHPLERVILRVLLLIIIAAVAVYVYLIAASTFNIIARKQAEVSSTTVNSSLAQTNAQYYQLSGQVTPARAVAIGLTPVAEKDYVTRTSSLGLATPVSR